MTEILDRVKELAGPQRAVTFEVVAKRALELGLKNFVETGCYRGIQGDGMSTVILGMLAQVNGGHAWSVDIYQGAVDKAVEITMNMPVSVTCADSVDFLRQYVTPIDVLYLDSYDYEEANPEPCQWHQLLEAAAAMPRMAPQSIILLDDCALPHGGKAAKADVLIRAFGWQRWHPEAQLYQNVYCRGMEL
jgi:hypothetical protein